MIPEPTKPDVGSWISPTILPSEGQTVECDPTYMNPKYIVGTFHWEGEPGDLNRL